MSVTSGSVCSCTFTPTVDGAVKVTATYTAAGSHSDFGSGSGSGWVYCTQSGTRQNGPGQSSSTSRLPYAQFCVFNVVAGDSVEAGLYGSIGGGPSSVTFWDVAITVEFDPGGSV